MTAVLDSAQETPPNASTAKGTAICIVDRDANTLTYTLQINGLSSAQTLAHIHGYAPPGTPAGIVHNLALGNFKSGVWNYPEADEANIVNGLAYFNIHTTMFGGGEIRGQIVKSSASVTMGAVLNGAQETPPTATGATGVGWVKFNTAANTLDYSLTFSGLTSAQTLAHIHGFAPAGTPAGIKVNLPLGNHINGTGIAYAAADEANYLAGLAYFNIHTSMFGGGEIRGQILAAGVSPATYCTAGTTTNGCLASISASANPSVSMANACVITVANVEGAKNGIIFYGLAPQSAPWGSGSPSFLCVKPPTQRSGAQVSGGTANMCDGTFMLDWNAYQTANPGALGNPWAVGNDAFAQAWFRDPPAPKTTNLSDAVMMTYVP